MDLNLSSSFNQKFSVFFQELITEIFSEIILENNVSNKPIRDLIVIHSNNCKKITITDQN